VDPNRLCSVPEQDPGSHDHFDPDPEPISIRINSDPDPTYIFRTFLKSKFLPINKCNFKTEFFFSTSLLILQSVFMLVQVFKKII